jgi:hypothetical protein
MKFFILFVFFLFAGTYAYDEIISNGECYAARTFSTLADTHQLFYDVSTIPTMQYRVSDGNCHATKLLINECPPLCSVIRLCSDGTLVKENCPNVPGRQWNVIYDHPNLKPIGIAMNQFKNLTVLFPPYYDGMHHFAQWCHISLFDDKYLCNVELFRIN